jgi:hypothetical protein
MDMVLLKALLLVFIFTAGNIYAENLPEFIAGVYKKNKKEIDESVFVIYKNGIDQVKGNVESIKNKEVVFPLLFYHFLFTSTDAVDCTRGGIFTIPYFWHWVNPNPRYSIIYLPTGKPLVQTKTIKGFEKYRSFADIDRTPFLFLKNLVSDSALFYHPQCGDFYTFGWCSEREMAFSNLMTSLRYKMKIKQQGIHVWSEVFLEIETVGDKKNICLLIDNTFNGLEFKEVNIPESKWRNDVGEGAQVRWYNRTAFSDKELNLVKSIVVSEKAKARMEKNIMDWIGK